MLQERFSGHVSLDLLSEEEMPHGSPIQGKIRVLLEGAALPSSSRGWNKTIF